MMEDTEILKLLSKLRSGSITKQEYRRLEMAALDDPFVFDALEGYTLYHTEEDSERRTLARIDQFLKEKRPRRYLLLAAAASLALLLSVVTVMRWGSVNKLDRQVVVDVVNTKSPSQTDYSDIVNVTINDQSEISAPTAHISKNTKTEGKGAITTQDTKPSPSEINNEESPIAFEDPSLDADDEVQVVEVAVSTSENENEVFYLDAPMEEEIYVEVNKAVVTNEGGKTKKIKGQVFSMDGEPILGATVMSQNAGAITDFDGNFSIVIDSAEGNLSVMFLGYEPKVINVSDAIDDLDVYLEESSGVLDEIVVVQYDGIYSEQWELFDNSLRKEAMLDLLKNGITGHYELEYSFQLAQRDSISKCFVIKSSHPVVNDSVVKWIQKSLSVMPSVPIDELIVRKLVID